MGGHGLISEGDLWGEHPIYVTKKVTFAASLRNEGTKEEVRGICLTEAKSDITMYVNIYEKNEPTVVAQW
jgi:hypothetical protein